MAWSRLDDTWYDHPKLMRLPDAVRNAAAGVRDRALSWSNRHLADGHVPDAVLRQLDCSRQLRAHLVTVGLFHEEPGGIYIHDYPEFNETRDELLERRDKAARAGKLGGLAKKRNANQTASDPLSAAPRDPVAPASDPLHHSPARPATNARAQNARPGPSPVPSPEETESLRERSEENRSPSREALLERTDVVALLDRGWTQVTPRQRAVLDEVLDHHTDTGPEWAAAIIRATPAEQDPLAAVMASERDRLRSERERADREGAAWRETKDREAREAKEAYERLFASRP